MTSKIFLKEGLSKHPRISNKTINYGTAGFRTDASQLDHIMFRMGILATLRSRLVKEAIGVMITASHNPEEDNGVKLIDPHGEMLEVSWESIATNIANVKDEELQQEVEAIIASFKIDMTLEANKNTNGDVKVNVMLGRDTRASSERLAQAVADGVEACNGSILDFHLLTTPQLHYIVLCYNSDNAYGQPSENGYYRKLGNAFIALNEGEEDEKNGSGNAGMEVSMGSGLTKKKSGNYLACVEVDGANGVGAIKLKQMLPFIGNSLSIMIHNTGDKRANGNERNETDGRLNHECGADFVKVKQQAPKGLPEQMQVGKRYLSFDGDADRIIYFYLNSIDQKFHMLDGDKIAVLLALYLQDMLHKAQLSNKLELCIVQTAYANGNSTSYIEDVLRVPVICVPTGVKHLHHRAQQSDIGVYFEANGHGTVVFSEKAKVVIKERSLTNKTAARLLTLIDLINETVGDAIADMLVVETILRDKGYSAQDWDDLYQDLPNRQLKVNVKDRNVITTGDAERKCITPIGLQQAIDDIVKRFGEKSRSFVRPSGTEDVVRVYAESSSREKADELAKEVANVVFDMAQGVGNKY